MGVEAGHFKIKMMKDLRPGVFATERKMHLLPLVIVITLLCGLSFYIGTIYYSERSSFSELIKGGESVPEKSGDCQLTIKQEPFPVCNISLQDNTPCSDPKVNHKTFTPLFFENEEV